MFIAPGLQPRTVGPFPEIQWYYYVKLKGELNRRAIGSNLQASIGGGSLSIHIKEVHITRFSFGFELFWGQSCSFTLYQRSAENGWLLTYIRLPHSTALFMTSLAQAAGHKMATFERRILTNSTRNRMKNRYVCFVFHCY